MRVDDEYTDLSVSQKETMKVQRVPETPRPELPIVPGTPKKTRLFRHPLSETTSEMMRIIRRARVDCLPEYFEQTCDRSPHDIAVICGLSQFTYLTYQELDHRANRLAHFLISQGVGKGDPIGLLLEHSLDCYVALLGVLKAGAAFVPLDPSFSLEEVVFIAEDANLRGLVTTSTFRAKTSFLPCSVLELDRAYEVLSVQHETRPSIHIDPASLCYIIYKLDTNNQPQGIAISHANIVNFLRVTTPIYGLSHKDRVSQSMSTTSNFSFQEIWPTWIAGATLVAIPNAQRLGYGLSEFLIEHKITVLCCTTSLLATIERDVPSLRILIISGDAYPPYLVNRWARPGRRILKMYGTAETTIAATWCELFPSRPITIGSPLPTYQVYILDEQLHHVEDGESGEIYIGGPGVAIGYHNRPDLTKERFIANPVMHDREVVPRLYRTGDVGRITLAGEIEYLGQVNHQFKIHNYRIPPQIDFSRANTTPLDAYISASQVASSAISELAIKTSKREMFSRANFKIIYNHIMTDPLYRNSIFTMASTFIVGGLGFFYWILIARLYKTEYVGIATTLISIITLLSNFTVLGLNSGLMRYLPKSTNKNALINSSFIIVTIVTCLISTAFLLKLQIFSPQLLFLQSNLLYLLSFIIFVLFYGWNSLIDSIFMAYRAASNRFIKNATISILKLILPFAFIAFGAYGIFASTALASTLGVLVGLVILIVKFKLRPSISVNISLVKETSAYSFANYITSFMLNMPSLVLPVIILNALSAKYAAYYYIASMLQSILQMVPEAVTQALLTEGAYNEAELKKHVKKATVTIAAILVPATAIVVFWGNLLLQFFGKNYASEAFQFLQFYSASTIFTSLILIANAIMNVKHQKKALMILNIVASVLTLWLSYTFISGKLVGVGWGWTLGQAIAGSIALCYIIPVLRGEKKGRKSRSDAPIH